MKHMKLVVPIFLLFAMLAFAAGTPEGTSICNKSYARYTGSRGIQEYFAESDSACIEIAFDASVEILPEFLSNTGYLENSVFFSHYIINHANGLDSFIVYGVNDLGWDVNVYLDGDGDGDPTDTDPAYDTLEPPGVGIDDTIYVLVEVVLGADDAWWGNLSETMVYARSVRNSAVMDSSFDTTLVVGPQVTLNLEGDPISPTMVGARDTIEYTLSAVNSDTDTTRQAVDAIFTTARDPNITFVDAPDPETGWDVEYFAGGSWTSTYDAAADSLRFVMATDDSMARGDSVAFSWQGYVIDCPADDSIWTKVQGLYFDTTGVHEYTTNSDSVVTGVNSASVTIVTDTTLYANLGDTVAYEMTITNNGDADDIYEIELIPGEWGDHPLFNTDCDGVLSGAESAEEDTMTESIGADGGFDCLTMRVAVPDTQVTLADTVQIVVTSTNDYCVADTVMVILNQIVPRIILNKDIIDELGHYTDLDPDVLPSDTVEYAIKFWNIERGLADSIVILDSLNYYTPLINGISQDDFFYQLPDDATASADWLVEYSTNSGSSWTPYTFGGSLSLVEAPTETEFVLLRITEIGSAKLQPASSPPDPDDDVELDTEQGQAEFRFKVLVR